MHWGEVHQLGFCAHLFLGVSSGVHIWSCLPTCAPVHTSLPFDLQMEAFTFYRLLTLTTWQFQWSEKMTDQLPIIVGDAGSVGLGVKGCPWRSANQLWMGQEGLGLRDGQPLRGIIKETRCPSSLAKTSVLDLKRNIQCSEREIIWFSGILKKQKKLIVQSKSCLSWAVK